MLIRNKVYLYIVIISFLIYTGTLLCFTCFSMEGNQIQASFSIQRGAILINANDNYPQSLYLLDAGISVPILEKRNDTNLEKYQKYKNVTLKEFDCNIPFIPKYQGKIILSDLSDISRKVGVPIKGILPIYYPGFEIYIDFGKGKLVWQLISIEEKVKTKDIACEKIFFSSESTIPQIPVTLNDKIVVVANIDFVRNEYVIFPMSFVNERFLITGDSKFVHFRNKKVIQYFRLKTLRLGNQKFQNLLSISVPGEKEISLGTSFWKQFVLKMNYEESKICFLKTNISDVKEWTGTGIVLDYLDEEGWVIGVVKNSSAWLENLRGGETLIKINEWNIKSLNPDQITQLLNSQAGVNVICTVKDLFNEIRSINIISQKIL
ncbi:MAG: hypothetical protein ACP5UA_03980 [Candidatus Hydrogenedens sp.]